MPWYCVRANTILIKAESEHTTLTRKIDELSDVINEAEDGIFADFCADVGIDNIRQYEQRQLKMAEQENETRVRFETQIARLQHQ
jgi:structural maintenance of chromosome 1